MTGRATDLNEEFVRSLPDDGPVVMVNLVRFRKHSLDGRGSGWDAYSRYSKADTPLLKKVGGTVLWAGHVEGAALGHFREGEHWDWVVLAQYPSRAAFLSMMTSPEYAMANVDRENGVEDHVILAANQTYSKFLPELAEPRRATTLSELQGKMERLVSEAGFAAGLGFAARPSDVVIASYAKCGTTWLQQIVHSLRTGGDLDFDDISRVVPWIETAADLGLDLDGAQRGEPRAFKSHLAYHRVPAGARYIVSVRDPRDALVSAYRFFEGWFFEPGSIDIETLGRNRFVEGRTYYTHLASWWPHRHDSNVLLLAYEHMKDDHEGTVRRVAEFIGFGGDDERIAIACRESSLASMKAHHDKYDDLMMRERSEVVCDLPPGGDSSKVRSGEVGAHRVELSGRLVADLDATWSETITADLGIPSYETLLGMLATGR